MFRLLLLTPLLSCGAAEQERFDISRLQVSWHKKNFFKPGVIQLTDGTSTARVRIWRYFPSLLMPVCGMGILGDACQFQDRSLRIKTSRHFSCVSVRNMVQRGYFHLVRCCTLHMQTR